MEYDVSKPVGQRVRNVKVRCSECVEPQFQGLEDQQVYGVLVNDFMVSGGNGYTMIQEEMIDRIYLGG